MTQVGPYDPTDRDEDEALRLQAILDATQLRADAGRDEADDADGPSGTAETVRCDGCRYYLNPGDALAYCWHPQLRILVGGSWRCRHHDPSPEAVT